MLISLPPGLKVRMDDPTHLYQRVSIGGVVERRRDDEVKGPDRAQAHDVRDQILIPSDRSALIALRQLDHLLGEVYADDTGCAELAAFG